MESPLRDLAPADLRVIETLGYVSGGYAPADGPEAGFRRLARHLDRAARTCARLGIPFDPAACEAALRAAVREAPAQTDLLRCRLTLDRQGRIEVTAAPLAPPPARWRVVVSDTRLAADDPWLTVKTSQRRLYDETRADLPAGIDEAIFLNARGEVCEGTISNVFARLEGMLLTPPQHCGLLPGILREELLETGAAVERILTLDDLHQTEALFLGNSLRGLIPADLD